MRGPVRPCSLAQAAALTRSRSVCRSEDAATGRSNSRRPEPSRPIRSATSSSKRVSWVASSAEAPALLRSKWMPRRLSGQDHQREPNGCVPGGKCASILLLYAHWFLL